MEKGFYHPSRGYWQTSSEPSEEIISSYPVGTISVPVKTRENTEFIDGVWAPVAPVITSAMVDAERDRRIALGFNWNGKHYQSRPEDILNIGDMALAATSKIAQGQIDTGYRWFDPNVDFAWIAADNTLTPMNIEDMMNFAMVAAKWKSDNIRAGSAIKQTPGGIPANFANDGRWPDAPAG